MQAIASACLVSSYQLIAVSVVYHSMKLDGPAGLAHNCFNPELKDVNFMEKHYCALVKLLLEECPDGKPFIAPECALAASSYLSTQDSLQSFLDEFCIREETAPVRQWLGVKEVFAKYNEETGAKLKEKDMKEKLKQHRATEGDYYEKGAATLSDRPLRRNTNNGLLNWRLKWQDCSESSKQQRVA